MAEDSVPHVAVLDIGLPEMSGHELASSLWAPCELPIDRTHRVRPAGGGREVTRTVHLMKPATFDAIVHEISKSDAVWRAITVTDR